MGLIPPDPIIDSPAPGVRPAPVPADVAAEGPPAAPPRHDGRRRRSGPTPRLLALITEAEGYAEELHRRRPKLGRTGELGQRLREAEYLMVRLQRRVKALERALQLERRARKYAVQLLNGHPTPTGPDGTLPLPEGRRGR